MRGREIVIKDIEVEDEIPVSAIPMIEEILANMLFAAWVSQRGVPSSLQQTQNEEKNYDSSSTETNIPA